MKYPSPADIAEMVARGYDRSVIDEATEQSKRWFVAEALKAEIRLAFAGVTLGDGIGLLEAQGIDDYADDETCAGYRRQDEKENWQNIPPVALNRCNSSLSFFDAAGMRFHLPAYLIADLDGTYGYGMAYVLAESVLCTEQMALLDALQRNAVRNFLCFIEDEPEYALQREYIQRALVGYWAE